MTTQKTLVQCGAAFNKHSGASASLVKGVERAIDEAMEAMQEAQRCEREAAEGDGERPYLDHLGFEMADVVLTLASLAATHSIDLDRFIREKHEVNMRRTWRKLPGGAVKHVR